MYVLGITGSMAMGKTTVTRMFAEKGYPAFFADEVVHRLFETKKGLRDKLAKEFPGAVKDNAVDRSVLGRAVFGRPERLARLEQTVHPYVTRALRSFLDRERARKTKMVVLDIPLLFEIAADTVCDGVLVVTADPGIQEKRGLKRVNYSKAGFEALIRRQMPDEEKRKRADFIIDTSGPLDETRKEVEKLLAKLPV